MPLVIDPTIPRFTRSELVDEMSSRFDNFTENTFRKWQERGLVAAPDHERRWAKGEPGTAKGLWSHNDRRTLGALLEQRERHLYNSDRQFTYPQLAPVVVWLWAYQPAGPDGKARSRVRIKQYAREAVTAVAAPGVAQKKQQSVATRLGDAVFAGDDAGRSMLGPDLQALIDPQEVGRQIRALGMGADAQSYLEFIRWAHLGARSLILEDGQVHESDWAYTRRVLRASWQEYLQDRSYLRASALTPALFTRPDLELSVTGCPRQVLAGLGTRISRRRNDS
jgi:hypothetical protein